MLLFLLIGLCQAKIDLLNTDYVFNKSWNSLFANYLVSANNLNFWLLVSEDTKRDVLMFSNHMIKYMLDSKIWSKSYNLKLIELNHTVQSYNYKSEKVFTIFSKESNRSKGIFNNVTEEQMINVRRFSADPEEVYIILCQSPDELNHLLDKNHKRIIQKARAIFSISFLFGPVPCRKIMKDVAYTLVRLWKEFNVLNVVARCPLSCNPNDIYIYKPFKKFAGVWGIIRVFDTKEVLQYPYVIQNHLINLGGFPVKISLFERSPTAVKHLPKGMSQSLIYNGIRLNSGFGGIDGSTVTAMSKYLNFTVEYVKDDSEFGIVLPNGSITGSLGQVVRKEVHWAANGRFLMDYQTDDIEFTTPYDSDELCVIAPKSERIPQWMVLFRSFSFIAWLTILSIIILAIIIWHFKKILHSHSDFSKAALEIFSIFVSIPVKLPSASLIPAICLILNVIFAGIFQGNLVKSFSTVSYYSDINSLEELDESGLNILSSLSVFNSDTALMKSLKRKTRNTNSSPLYQAAYRRSAACLERKYDALLYMETIYVSSDGLPLLHLLNECPNTYFLSYIVPRGSPFLPRFNSVIMKFVESGLSLKWYDDVFDSLVVESKLKNPKKEKAQKSFTLRDMQSCFYILLFGHSISLVVFLWEHWYYEKVKKIVRN